MLVLAQYKLHIAKFSNCC